MNIRDILLVILYISLENVYGKSLKFVVHSDAELTSKHHIHESNRHLRLRRTNEKLSKHKNEKNIHSEDVVDHFDNSLEFSVAGNENEKVNNAHVKTISRRDDSAGDDCTNDNCSIVFENAGDDGENLMEEEKEEEEEEAEHLSSSKKETAHKTKKISHKDDGSGNNELVEQDRHIGTENSQHNRQSHKNNKGESSSATTEKESAGIKTKDKQVVLMPQSSVQEGTKSQVSNISDVAKYPSLPIPQMIPLPLFYNSGESEGSAANHLTSMAKNTKEVEDFNGESGYGELPIHKEHTQSAKTVLLNGENEAGKSIKGHAQKTPAGKHVKGVKDDKNSTKSKPIPTRLLTESIDFHSGAGKSVKAKGKKILTDKTNHHEKAPIVEVDRNIGDITENRAVINNGETTTDYPFVVSAGPKANIHVNGNSKIKIGNDHDEDLVDDYDDDDGEGEKGGSRRHKKVSSKVETGSGENKDFTSGESSNANSIPIQDMEGNGVSDFKEEKAEDEEDDDEPVENQEPVKSTESSGSGSGEVATEYSGEAGQNRRHGMEEPPKEQWIVEHVKHDKDLDTILKETSVRQLLCPGVPTSNPCGLPCGVPPPAQPPPASPCLIPCAGVPPPPPPPPANPCQPPCAGVPPPPPPPPANQCQPPCAGVPPPPPPPPASPCQPSCVGAPPPPSPPPGSPCQPPCGMVPQTPPASPCSSPCAGYPPPQLSPYQVPCAPAIPGQPPCVAAPQVNPCGGAAYGMPGKPPIEGKGPIEGQVPIEGKGGAGGPIVPPKNPLLQTNNPYPNGQSRPTYGQYTTSQWNQPSSNWRQATSSQNGFTSQGLNNPIQNNPSQMHHNPTQSQYTPPQVHNTPPPAHATPPVANIPTAPAAATSDTSSWDESSPDASPPSADQLNLPLTKKLKAKKAKKVKKD